MMLIPKDDAERPALVEKYTALFGKPHITWLELIKLWKLQITEKEAEQTKGNENPLRSN